MILYSCAGRITLYCCDRCGRSFAYKLDRINTFHNGSSFCYDICSACYSQFDQFITLANKQKMECVAVINFEKKEENA